MRWLVYNQGYDGGALRDSLWIPGHSGVERETGIVYNVDPERHCADFGFRRVGARGIDVDWKTPSSE